MSDTIPPTPILGWVNVGLALSFIGFDVVVSSFLGLGVGRSLLTAALRCILQLAVVAGLLQKVFEAENPWAVAGITCKSACNLGGPSAR
jgi:ABC-type iron transport system FetAB permease component